MDVAFLRAAFGWAGAVAVSAGPRGALGQVFRVEVGGARYALKELFGGPPAADLVAAEVGFAARARAAGVRVPVSRPDRAGRYVVPAPDGRWLRLYEWVDLCPLDPAVPGVAVALGGLLARLHGCAPAAVREPGGEPPDPWYERVPAGGAWPVGVAAAWAGRLADLVVTLPALCAAVGPPDPGRLVVCHRDLHPENVLADAATGELVVVDWDNLGPADPGRELARVLFDWFCDSGGADLDAVARMYGAYVEAGGPGRITSLADFTMLLAGRLNFLLRQVAIALDPAAEPRHREWAEREIAEALDIAPTPAQLAAVLGVVAG